MHGNPIGGLIFLAYLALAWSAWSTAGLNAGRRGIGGVTMLRLEARRRAWAGIAIVLLCLALFKLTGLDARIVDDVRQSAERGGWYGARRGEQRLATRGLLGGGAALLAGLLLAVRRAGWWTLLAVAASMALALFVAVRAVSLHAIDRLLAHGIGPLRLGHAIELAGLAAVGLSQYATRAGTARARR